jgi:hypothetical protein
MPACMHALLVDSDLQSTYCEEKNFIRLKTNNKSTGEALQQPADYLKNRTEYTTECQL